MDVDDDDDSDEYTLNIPIETWNKVCCDWSLGVVDVCVCVCVLQMSHEIGEKENIEQELQTANWYTDDGNYQRNDDEDDDDDDEFVINFSMIPSANDNKLFFIN